MRIEHTKDGKRRSFGNHKNGRTSRCFTYSILLTPCKSHGTTCFRRRRRLPGANLAASAGSSGPRRQAERDPDPAVCPNGGNGRIPGPGGKPLGPFVLIASQPCRRHSGLQPKPPGPGNGGFRQRPNAKAVRTLLIRTACQKYAWRPRSYARGSLHPGTQYLGRDVRRLSPAASEGVTRTSLPEG